MALNGLKICVIGAGSTYTPELVEGLIEYQPELPVRCLSLMDVDRDKLEIVGGLGQRMAQRSGANMTVELTEDRRRALEGADYVITQIRVGMMPARILDEKTPLPFGTIGQETTGPGGFAKALRTIPVILDIAKDIHELAPDAFLVNFTNPSGLITEALQAQANVRSLGLCNIPIGVEMAICKELGVTRDRLRLDWVGLNHLNWLRGVSLDGQDIWPQVFGFMLELARQSETDSGVFSPELLETLGMIPCGYLNYYYNLPSVFEKQKAAAQTRGEEVREIEAELMKMYKDPGLKEKPKLLEKRGGAYYSKAAISLIASIANDKGDIHIVNTRNCGATPDLADDDVIEISSVIGSKTVQPQPVGRLPLAVRGLIQAVKAYEKLTVQAAVSGDRRLALQALLAHPLVPSYEAAKGLLKALLEAHRTYLPQFFPGD